MTAYYDFLCFASFTLCRSHSTEFCTSKSQVMITFVCMSRLAAGLRERGGRLDCKQRGSACRGFPPCCNDDVCYWENGFSPSRVTYIRTVYSIHCVYCVH